MSRGLGEIQRFILAELEAGPPGGVLDVPLLAVRCYGSPTTAAQVETVRRAIRTLAARGLIEARTFNSARGPRVEVRRTEAGREEARVRRTPETASAEELVDQEVFRKGAQAICPTCGGTGLVPVEQIGGVTRK